MTDEQAQTMNSECRLYCLHSLTPLHVGAGRGVGFIDLPIAREVVTNWPYVPGSAVKGVLADHYQADEARRNDDSLEKVAFGSGGDEHSNSGSLVFTDAHLVCLPVRSLYGTFAWCTCPLSLERLRRDLESCSLGSNLPTVSLALPAEGVLPIQIPSSPTSVLASDGAVYFEDLDFLSVPCEEADKWAKALAAWAFAEDSTWRQRFAERFAVIHDDVFTFLTETATQVDTRVKIDDDTKTVATGQLWSEESLPAETILAGIVWCGPVYGTGQPSDTGKRKGIIEKFVNKQCQLQIGGKATVGRGRVSLQFTPCGKPQGSPSVQGGNL